MRIRPRPDATAAAEATNRTEVMMAVASLAALIDSTRKQEEILAAFHAAEDVSRGDLGEALRHIHDWLPSFLYRVTPFSLEIERYLSVRKEEGKLIDPETAKVQWGWGQI